MSTALSRSSDEEIASTVLLAGSERCKQVVETSGAAASRPYSTTRWMSRAKVVCVLSGGNIDVSFIHKIVEKGLVHRRRQLKFRC